MEESKRRSVSMSCTCGMFSRVTSSSVRMAAAMQGRAEFFAPETLMVPSSGFPPRTTNLSIGLVYREAVWRGVGRDGAGGEVEWWNARTAPGIGSGSFLLEIH